MVKTMKKSESNKALSSQAPAPEAKLQLMLPGNGQMLIKSFELNGTVRLCLAEPLPASEISIEGSVIRVEKRAAIISSIELLGDGAKKCRMMGDKDADPEPNEVYPVENEQPKRKAPPPVLGTPRKVGAVPPVPNTPRVRPLEPLVQPTPKAKRRPASTPASVQPEEKRVHRYDTRSKETPKRPLQALPTKQRM